MRNGGPTVEIGDRVEVKQDPAHHGTVTGVRNQYLPDFAGGPTDLFEVTRDDGVRNEYHPSWLRKLSLLEVLAIASADQNTLTKQKQS